MAQTLIARRIQEQLAGQIGRELRVDEVDGIIRLSGEVESEVARDTAVTIAARIAPDKRIENKLDVETSLADDIAGMGANDARATDPIESLTELDEEGALEPDFTDQVLDSNVAEAVEEGNASTNDLDPDSLDDTVFFPPTDPVVTVNDRGDTEVLGGFSPTSMISEEVEPSAEDNELGDEAIADAVRRELREDAATTDLRIHVSVVQGVVFLRGRVPGIEDVDNAEAVAGNVPGVEDVVEELSVADL